MSVILQVKWGANSIMLAVSPDETVREVKLKLQKQTHVEAGNQKIMGWLPKGKIPDDNAKISELNLKSPHKVHLFFGFEKNHFDYLITLAYHLHYSLHLL